MQIDDVPKRHFQGPGDTSPEAEHGEKFRREAQIVLDEEGADDGR